MTGSNSSGRSKKETMTSTFVMGTFSTLVPRWIRFRLHPRFELSDMRRIANFQLIRVESPCCLVRTALTPPVDEVFPQKVVVSRCIGADGPGGQGGDSIIILPKLRKRLHTRPNELHINWEVQEKENRARWEGGTKIQHSV